MKINPQNTIRRVKGYEKDAYTYYPILVVGAGESGIALGCRLKEKLEFDQFRIFERQSGIGGTWWINRYPGVACDVPGVFYSFSFRPNPTWSTFFPSGPEIAKYLYTVCDEYKLVDKIQLNTDVSEMRWLVDEEEWEVTLTHMVAGTGDLSTKDRHKRIAERGQDSVYLKQEIVRAKIVASAAGGLVEPNSWPKPIPGRDSFKGDVFHSARWNYDVDLNGKDVIVVGTGCSAAQFVPMLTKSPYNAKSVTQVMRSPPWVVPRLLPPGGHEKWEKYAPKLFSTVPALARTLRTLLFLYAESDFYTIFLDKYKEKRKPIEAQLIEHMKKTVPEKYHEILTPDYGVGCKRRIFDATWLPSLNDPKILLTTQPLTSIQPQGVTLGPGRTYPDPKDADSKAPTEEIKLPADTIILANGFELTTWLHPLKIYGKDGKLMQDVWDERGGPQAYLGSAMDGYPNLFIIFGPNTATGHSSVILASENMVEYSLKFIERILNGDVKTVEVKHEAEVSWTKKMQEKLKDTVWMNGGCHSWYKTANGWNATAYPPLTTPEAIMPSSRRSQKLSLKDSLIPSSTSSTKKPSGKAKADAAGKAKADDAARTIVDAAVKANTAGAAVKANCPRNSKGHIIDSFKAAKKASPLNQPSRIPVQGLMTPPRSLVEQSLIDEDKLFSRQLQQVGNPV